MMGMFASLLEPALTVGSSAVAQPLSGLWGILNGGDADAVRRAQAALTYLPYTDGGKANLKSLGDFAKSAKETMVDRNPPVKALVDAYQGATDKVGEISPTLGAAMATLPTALTLAGGPTGRAVDSALLAAGQRFGPSIERAVERIGTPILERGGLPAQLMSDLTQGTTSNVYLPHTPSKPNPLVGTRFQTQFVGNMAPKTPMRIEDMKGASILAMPWDSTSRGYNVLSVSDETLPYPVLTTGGQDFARDLAHIQQNVGGASNLDIAKRIQDRVSEAYKENRHFGGNGDVYSLPSTMGDSAENFSTMPTEVLLGLAQRANLTGDQIAQLNDWVRNSPIIKNKKRVLPFTNFKGIDTDAGLLQFITGEGLDTTAGELRKAFANELGKVRGQQMLNYNLEDLRGALLDPSLRGVPKGYVGNTVIRSDPFGMLTASDHPSYSTNFPGIYQGSLGRSIPMEVVMPKTYRMLAQELAGKKSNLRQDVINAIEKRKNGVSELVDNQVIDSVNQWLEANK